MINQRAPKPSMEHMNASRAAFIQANLRPERESISQKLQAWGIQQDDDFEYNLGSYLNRVSEEVSLHETNHEQKKNSSHRNHRKYC